MNENLNEMDIKFLPGGIGKKDYSGVQDGDVVILPAFGATLDEMSMLDAKNVKIVDTTCPWVSKVWNAVDNHMRKDQTSVIHGKWAHEETIATASMCKGLYNREGREGGPLHSRLHCQRRESGRVLR